MKFGVFLPNGSNGYIMSSAIPPYLPTWELNKEATLEAERQGLDFVLSMMKFRGFGGATGHWDACLESFTLAGVLASITSRIGLIPTATILALHPAYVGRMVATLDDVSGGRIGLNIVSGWNRLEYAQMGLWRGDEYYGKRYEYALPYVEILRALWRDGRVTHKSRFFELNDCHCFPRPRHEIPIVSAGQSSAGRRFVAQIGGHSFAMAPPECVCQDSPPISRNRRTSMGRERKRTRCFTWLRTILTRRPGRRHGRSWLKAISRQSSA